MPSLLDALDRFNYTATSIRSLAQTNLPATTSGPFTTAILDLTLQDTIREADETEYGLFSFVKEAGANGSVAPQGIVSRREFKGATPLRTKRVNKEEEPEVYVEAALKYLDRFHAVKPMPDAREHLEALIDRLNNVRDDIERIQTSLEETTQTGRVSPKSQIVEEERRIGELKSRILQLRKRASCKKEALSSTLPPPLKAVPRTKSTARSTQLKSKIPSPPSASNPSPPSSSHSTPSGESSVPNFKPKVNPRARVPGPSAGKTIPSDSNKRVTQEEEKERLFWSGKKPPKITNDCSSSLLEEELDITGMDSLMSPTPAVRAATIVDKPRTEKQEPRTRTTQHDEEDDDDDDDENDNNDNGEPTIVVSKLNQVPAALPPAPPSRPVSQASTVNSTVLETPAKGDKTTDPPPSTKTKVRRVRVTPEMERICGKIWSTIADLLVPGNNFTTTGKSPPNAKDTITILQTIAAQPIPDPTSPTAASPSPSTRSTLSSLLGIETLGPTGGSPHQIMTAQVLLLLLTTPNHAMGLTGLKAQLASKMAVPSPAPDAGREAKQSAAAMGASAQQAGTRALYGCVAKKLVKIDRGGGEQIVRFD